MSLFPFLDREDNENDFIQQKRIPVEYEINFDTGKLTGKKVFGKDAIKVWIYKAIKTSRYKHLIYTWDYGVEVEDLISKSFDRDFIESELQRYIKEALLVNSFITDVNNFSMEFSGTLLICNFTVVTDFGEVDISGKYPKL